MSYKLLSVGADAKTVKGNGDKYITGIVYMKPYKTVWQGKVHNLCARAETAKCHDGCLDTAGRGQMDTVQAARLRKSLFWISDRKQWISTFEEDLTVLRRRAHKNGQQPCCRPNGTTDILHERSGFIQRFSDIQFYDYTKNYERAYRQMPSNYHLTLSYSEANMEYADAVHKAVLDTGINMAVVFRNKNIIPTTFRGLPVVDGDKDDLRFLDPKGCVVALIAKGKAKLDTTGFVIG
jgi:hypothetical protein